MSKKSSNRGLFYFEYMLLIIFLLLPNIVLYLETGNIDVFLLSIVLIVFLLSLIKKTKFLIFLIPFYLLIPFLIYYIFYYKISIDEQILSIILETNIQESLEFLGSKFYFYLFLFLFWFISIVYISSKSYKKSYTWSHRSRWWILATSSIYIIFSIAVNQRIVYEIDNNFSNNFLVSEKNSFIQDIKKTFPFGLFVSFYDFYNERQKINQAFELNKNFKFNVQQDHKEILKKQIYILVIGETSRRHNWSLNGYNRETNPLLSQQKNLVNFNNMLSISTATRSSIPMMITRKPAEQVFDYNFIEKSIISVFNEAGFSTYWISTQQKFGAFDTSTSVYAKEADYMWFLNKTSYKNKGDTDEVILPELVKAINSVEDKKFIIIHTLGSHYNYSHRYTGKFDIFKPSLNDIKNYSMQDKRSKTEILNSYDNSIIYTDYFLNQVIDIVKSKKDAESFLFFASDHGEDLFDDLCNKSGHGNNTIYNFEIASFAWYSDLYKNNNPEKIKFLNLNRNHKINQTSIFPTLVDAANVKIPNDQLNKSLLKEIEDYPRLVNGGIDFDKTQAKGVCKEIQ